MIQSVFSGGRGIAETLPLGILLQIIVLCLPISSISSPVPGFSMNKLKEEKSREVDYWYKFLSGLLPKFLSTHG